MLTKTLIRSVPLGTGGIALVGFGFVQKSLGLNVGLFAISVCHNTYTGIYYSQRGPFTFAFGDEILTQILTIVT